MITKEKLKKNILQKLSKNSQVFVDSIDNIHFNIIVISSTFDNLSKLEQQKHVYKIINNLIISGDIHAVEMKTYTPKQWKMKT